MRHAHNVTCDYLGNKNYRPHMSWPSQQSQCHILPCAALTPI